MKRTDFYLLIQPLTEKLYRFAYNLLPDDLQAEQLVIDGLNAYLIKEGKSLLRKDIDLKNKKETQFMRRLHFKNILRFIGDIGVRRAGQMNDRLKLDSKEYAAFYALDAKVRFVISLRYDAQFSVDEIEEIASMPRYEVIEKIHNGRFLLLNDLNKGVTV